MIPSLINFPELCEFWGLKKDRKSLFLCPEILLNWFRHVNLHCGIGAISYTTTELCLYFMFQQFVYGSKHAEAQAKRRT